MKDRSTQYFFCLSVLVMAVACDTEPVSNKSAFEIEGNAVVEQSKVPVTSSNPDLVISDIPFPFEILDNLHSKKILFNVKSLNKISNSTKYNQFNSKALNLGIYGADLAYLVTYDQFQDIGPYLKNAKKIAEDLNIPYAFGVEAMNSYDMFKTNKDSLTKCVCRSYKQVDNSLRKDEREGIAALVVAGSWLEGLYLSTKTFLDTKKTPDNCSLYKTIGEQKASLIIVIKLLEGNKKNAYFYSIINSLQDIVSDYNNVSADNTLNEKQLEGIHEKTEKLRNRIIEGM
jgi:hypothetical protein